MRRTYLTAVTGLAVLASSVFAQPIGMDVQSVRDKQNKKLDPPTLQMKSNEGTTLALIAALGLMGVALAANVAIPPKRGHQD